MAEIKHQRKIATKNKPKKRMDPKTKKLLKTQFMKRRMEDRERQRRIGLRVIAAKDGDELENAEHFTVWNFSQLIEALKEYKELHVLWYLDNYGWEGKDLDLWLKAE